MRTVTPFISETDLMAFSNHKNESDEMQQRRLKGLQQYQQLPLPTFQKFHYQRWPLFAGDVVLNDQPDLTSATQIKSQAMVSEVGRAPIQVQLSLEAQQKGVIALNLFTAQQDYPELLAKYYATMALPADAHRLAAFNVAAANCGVLLYIPANTVLSEPITLEFWQDATANELYVQHVLIIAAQNTQATILETRHTIGSNPVSANIVEEIILEADAHLRFTAIDELTQTSYLARHAYLMNNAQLDWALGLMNDGNVVADFNTDLIGTGSHAEVKAVAISTGSQVQGITTRVTNYAQHTIGNIMQHGVILSDATLVFNGIGHIVKGARGSDAQQENRVLMLSKTARGDANPILLIDENDVRAGHAASVGRVNEQQMYYLMSRGLAKDLAERLVIRGFLGSVLAEIPVPAAQEALKRTIERKLIDGQKHRDSAQ